MGLPSGFPSIIIFRSPQDPKSPKLKVTIYKLKNHFFTHTSLSQCCQIDDVNLEKNNHLQEVDLIMSWFF